MKKKQIDVYVRELYSDLLHNRPLIDIITDLQKLQAEFPGGYLQLDYDDGFELALWNKREETDEEYEARLKRQAKARKAAATAKEKQEIIERELYERLKKKYEPTE